MPISSDFVSHLRPETWAAVNRALVRKAIAELSHERLIQPADAGAGTYVLQTDAPGVVYRFRARRLSLDHWHIDEASIDKRRGDTREPLDAVQLVLELRDTLRIAEEMLPTYLEELYSTLYAAAYREHTARWSASELAQADFQDIEASMTAGHPCFLANSGRIGFDAGDYRAYAPEAAAPMRVVWLAGRRDRTFYHARDDLPYEALLQDELGAETLASFRRVLEDRGLPPDDYVLFPVHPWQWLNKVQSAFAGELGTSSLVLLGESPDRYQAQQSIRTLFNLDRPTRRYVKSSLSILNMGFMRGLSPQYMEGTPAINQWLERLIAQDSYLQALQFGILAEVATVGYRHPAYEASAPRGSGYKKMLSTLWRESPLTRVQPHERLMTGAALLHQDEDGGSLVWALIEASGVDPDAWLRRYLRAYLAPLVHCLFTYDMAFMPHGENTILVLEDHLVDRVLMKDIAEEVVILDRDADLPERVRRIAVDVPDDEKPLAIFTDVFDCFFRFLAAVLHQHGYAQERFWALVAECIRDYQQAHPELQAKFERYDLFAPAFALSCLNRLQLANNRQMVDLTDPSKALQFAGSLNNPIASHRPAQRAGGAAKAQKAGA